MPEVISQWLVEAVGEVTHPNEGIREDVDGFFHHELRTVAVASDRMQLVQAVGLAVFGISALFARRRIKVQPPVAIVQLSRVVLTAVVVLVGALQKVLVIQQIEDVLVFPIDGRLPVEDVPFVDETVQFDSVFGLSEEVIFVVVFSECVAVQGVLDPLTELAVFVV